MTLPAHTPSWIPPRLRPRGARWRLWIGLAVLGAVAVAGAAFALTMPPLQVDILDAQEKRTGRADVYLNYVELADANGTPRGAIGVLLIDGQARLFLVQADGEHKLVGYAENHRLYNGEGKLIGYYAWTPIWSYVYDDKMKKVGQAQCIAYQGVCAAGIAGYLLGLY